MTKPETVPENAPATTAGYSERPLAKKLGVKAGSNLLVVNEPPDYRELLAPLPDDVTFVARISQDVDLLHLFCVERATLAQKLAVYRSDLGPEAVVWVSWPKKAAKVPTDITEDVIREVALPLGFVDVKVCAVDETWSGLKLILRKALR
jgi:hypothetical protein